MASMNTPDVPLVHNFEFSDGMRLQVNVTGFANGRNAKVELILRNSSRVWVLHWGCIFQNNKNWFVPAVHPTGTNAYKQGALQTPFVKSGDVHVIVIQLHDSKICAIQFVLKDDRHNTWLKINQGNFEIKIPKITENTTLPPIPKDVIERRAYQLWESRGRPVRSLQDQKQDYEDAVREVQALLAKGMSLDELQRGSHTTETKKMLPSKEEPVSQRFYLCRKRHGIEQWIQRHNNKDLVKKANFPSSVLTDTVKKSIGGDDMLSQQYYYLGIYEIVILSKIVGGNYHVVVAANTKGPTVLHWGISKLHPGEWLTPPPDILPEKSKLLDAACQTHFMDSSAGNGTFQFVDINLQQRKILGIQFVIWSGGKWINNNGANFCVALNLSRSGKVQEDGKCLKWLLDEISYKEKEAERSLMHRFNIATELTDRCKTEGQLGLIGILVWLRFMACRQLTWNKNYNVKPREISEAQERFTNLLQRIYLNQPHDREIVRLIMGCVGRGGQGDVGQRIRDEILVLQRNNDCKGGMMEEWHQKLHNNSSPDDVIICEALLNYVKSGFKIECYWQTLNANGISKEILASYDRPILSEPRLRTDAKEGLLRDLTSYLKTLKAVHSGADLESAIETCLCNFSKSFDVKNSSSAAGVSPKLQEYLHFVKEHVRDKNIAPLMEKLLESRIELRPALLTSHGRLKDFIFLDIALDSTVRTTIEGALKDLNFACIPEIMFFIALVLESLCLSSVNNEALVYCTKDWYRLSESYKSNDGQWALQTKAILDRARLILGAKAQYYQEMIQPSAQYLGRLLTVDQRVIENFSEELIRAGSAASLSMLVNRLDPVLRKVANLGSWQIISPVDANGLVVSVSELKAIQDKVYRNPTVIIANKVYGEEEIPEGVVAVLTADTPDVLSHVSIRARNNKVLFASCFDQNLFGNLKLKHGKAVSIQVRSNSLIISDISSYGVAREIFISSSTPRVTLKNKFFSGKFAISAEDFSNQLVGVKSCNIRLLRQRVPSWIKIPTSVAIPFRVFETVLSQDTNKDLASKISGFTKLVDNGDLSKLRAIQETVLQMKAPFQLTLELQNKMKASRIPWPGDEGEARWNQAWMAIKKVWASKWNERAYISTRKAKLDHNNICMAVLVQEIICADYAFVIHTKNPISGDTSEIFTEIVKGLGETLVGAYPGRAMCFITKKSNLKSPTVIGYPSKLVGLYVNQTIIFRSDSNGEDLEEYAGAGLYDSVTMDKAQEVVLDYSNDRLITDGGFRTSVFGKIAEAGKTIEDIYGCAQDIEGVVKGGEIYVVQTRPQI